MSNIIDSRHYSDASKIWGVISIYDHGDLQLVKGYYSYQINFSMGISCDWMYRMLVLLCRDVIPMRDVVIEPYYEHAMGHYFFKVRWER